jgi:hypothetical protein
MKYSKKKRAKSVSSFVSFRTHPPLLALHAVHCGGYLRGGMTLVMPSSPLSRPRIHPIVLAEPSGIKILPIWNDGPCQHYSVFW